MVRMGGRSAKWMALGASACALAVPSGAAADGPGNGNWHPGPARYGMSSQRTDVRMSDGILLSATITRPTDPASGRPASGRFPVILVATPYGKDEPGFSGVDDTPTEDYVPHGYIYVLVDIRGT